MKTNTISKFLKRYMNLHEYQASQLLGKFNLPVVPGGPASSIQEANNIVSVLSHLNPLGFVIKA
jgi:succinyl-CoA synthetase beta subunit